METLPRLGVKDGTIPYFYTPLPGIEEVERKIRNIRCSTIVCLGMPEKKIYDLFISTGAKITIYAVLDSPPAVIDTVLIKNIHPEHAHYNMDSAKRTVDVLYISETIHPNIYQRVVEIWFPRVRKYGIAILPYSIDKQYVCFIHTQYTTYLGRSFFDVSIYSKYGDNRNDGWFVTALKE